MQFTDWAKAPYPCPLKNSHIASTGWCSQSHQLPYGEVDTQNSFSITGQGNFLYHVNLARIVGSDVGRRDGPGKSGLALWTTHGTRSVWRIRADASGSSTDFGTSELSASKVQEDLGMPHTWQQSEIKSRVRISADRFIKGNCKR